MLLMATSYHAGESFHFVMYSVMKSYEMDVILLFGQEILVKQQNDIHFI